MQASPTSRSPRPAAYAHRVPVLTSRFRYADHTTLFGHAHLFGDRIELVGWHLRGRRTRRIPLDDIVELDYHPLERGSNLSLATEEGETIDLCVDDAHRWREAFERWLDYSVLASAKLIPEMEKATALAG